jgi:hypothetical protein
MRPALIGLVVFGALMLALAVLEIALITRRPWDDRGGEPEPEGPAGPPAHEPEIAELLRQKQGA